MNKKIMSPDAVALLSAIMRTCPSTPLNGGEHARKHLELLCAKGGDVSGCELLAGVKIPESCECEGHVDVYSHLLSHVKSDVITRKDVMLYFGGHVHASKIFKEAMESFTDAYSLRIVYGHLLVPVNVIDVEKGMVADRNITSSFGVLKFEDADFSNGDIAVMHYGFLVDRITQEEAELLSACNNKSDLFKKALRVLQMNMNFKKMHYYPRSLRIAREQ